MEAKVVNEIAGDLVRPQPTVQNPKFRWRYIHEYTGYMHEVWGYFACIGAHGASLRFACFQDSMAHAPFALSLMHSAFVHAAGKG